MISMDTPIEPLTQAGKTVAARLKKLGVFNVSDLIRYFPFRYDDFSNLKAISKLEPGEMATVRGRIELLTSKRSYRKRMVITECFLTDETGSVKAIWFGQPYIAKVLKSGDEVFFSGKVEGNLLELFLTNPSFEKVSADTTHTARLVPIYSLTGGLTQKQLRFLIKHSLKAAETMKECLPGPFRE